MSRITNDLFEDHNSGGDVAGQESASAPLPVQASAAELVQPRGAEAGRQPGHHRSPSTPQARACFTGSTEVAMWLICTWSMCRIWCEPGSKV